MMGLNGGEESEKQDLKSYHSSGQMLEARTPAALNVPALWCTWDHPLQLFLQSQSAPHPFRWFFFRSQGKRVISPQTRSSLWDPGTSGSEQPEAENSRSYPPSDVFMQHCLQGERWTLMNKYEDNLHLCCTFFLSLSLSAVPHLVLLKKKE